VVEMNVSNDEEHNLKKLVMSWLPGMISELTETYREAVDLYELHRVPQKQIADKLGISLSGAKSKVQRGREKLKAILFDCCSFENDRRGNVIGYRVNKPEECKDNCSC